MGSGLSMASVNKIKELANAREYSLALDIIDSQDLSKSLNPQFLRLCGEVYTYNKRYGDARKVLLIAHRLAPEAKRVIYSLIYLYLKMGYRELARTYYEIYMFDADEAVLETKQLLYIYGKAQKQGIDDLEQYIAPAYSHTMDYDWTYETFLIYMLQGRRKEAENLAQIYGATFKKSENSLIMESVLAGDRDVNELFDVFADEEIADDEPEQEAERELEQKLLEADELRIHPREPEITIMVDDDDDDEIEIGSKRKLKKFLKEQERLEREANAEQETASQPMENVPQPEGDESETGLDDKKGKKLFKGLFQKKKKEQPESAESSDAETDKKLETIEKPEEAEKSVADESLAAEEKKPEETEKPVADESPAAEEKEPEEAEKPVADESPAAEEKEPEEAEKSVADESPAAEEKEPEEAEKSVADESPATEEEKPEETEKPVADEAVHREEYEKARAIFFGEGDEPQTDLPNEKNKNSSTSIQIEMANTADEETEELSENMGSEIKQSQENEGLDMREIHVKEHNSKRNSIVSIDFDEGDFAAESETIEDLKDSSDFDNSFDSVDAAPQETHTSELKIKKSITFEEADMADEDEEVFAVDDFSTPEDDEFGKMHVFAYQNASNIEEEPRDEIGDTQEILAEEEIEAEIQEEAEVETDTDVEEEVEVETDTDVEEEVEVETDADVEEEVKVETDTDVEEEVIVETDIDVEEEVIVETDADVEEEAEVETDTGVEEEAEVETDTGVEEEAEVEADTDVEENAETEEAADEEATFDEAEERLEFQPEDEPENLAELFKQTPKKKALDYPVFRSSLFPDYHKDIVEVTNNFDYIMHEANDKIQENLLKEEQMQREAEALLASLGIDMESVSVTAEDYDSVSEALYDGPSRDELKTSLKIDSVKKDILRKLKEYR